MFRYHTMPVALTRSSAPSRNIKPVRDFLRQSGGKRTLICWLSAGFVGNNNSAVVCTADHIKSETRLTSVGTSALSNLMEFLPLRLDFGEFCRKALCSEVRRCINRCVLARYDHVCGFDGWFWPTSHASLTYVDEMFVLNPNRCLGRHNARL